MRLKDQVALVMGGGRGIGRSIALAFAREGADVAVAARSEPEIAAVRRDVEGLGRCGLAGVCDVSDGAQVAGLVREVQETLGPITILVNSAGMAASVKTTEMDDALWGRIVRVKLTENGRAMLEKAVSAGADYFAGWLAAVPHEERRTFIRVYRRVAELIAGKDAGASA